MTLKVRPDRTFSAEAESAYPGNEDRVGREELRRVGRDDPVLRVRGPAGAAEPGVRLQVFGRDQLKIRFSDKEVTLLRSERIFGRMAGVRSVLAALVLLIAVPLTSHAEILEAELQVNGMSCPFCAFGIEKKLRRVEGV